MASSSEESIYKLANTLKQTRQLNFTISTSLPSSVLSTKDEFEETYLREAKQNEICLFQLDDHQPAGYRMILDSTVQELANVSKTVNLGKSKQQRETGDVVATRSSLMAIQTLLSI
ncbi:uncharacterized protein MELLADRAFT_74953 [Melampsora larici-populina 98AG31]|uniref:Uncharacterized protein n=1 Tax=Melampsora larici-populina (strain 98AG31 / pathotype 3-4-7) TaxID=747676 RepID=F4RPE6_MELLP|nr:uncharacterized protein MELLADRAFT_74953 [Melampsora larici-populina 98AG31]EGG05859.1 hypothetical protein MELLADRAFT_74953 [Melampsora larici-populina 98AG31]